MGGPEYVLWTSIGSGLDSNETVFFSVVSDWFTDGVVAMCSKVNVAYFDSVLEMHVDFLQFHQVNVVMARQ